MVGAAHGQVGAAAPAIELLLKTLRWRTPLPFVCMVSVDVINLATTLLRIAALGEQEGDPAAFCEAHLVQHPTFSWLLNSLASAAMAPEFGSQVGAGLVRMCRGVTAAYKTPTSGQLASAHHSRTCSYLTSLTARQWQTASLHCPSCSAAAQRWRSRCAGRWSAACKPLPPLVLPAVKAAVEVGVAACARLQAWLSHPWD